MGTFYKSAEIYYSEMTSTMNDVDISKHSLIYNALMPVCYELSYQSLMLDEVLNMVFASAAYTNSYSNYLDLRVDEVGLKRKLEDTATGTIKVMGTPSYSLPANSTVSTTSGVTFTTDANVTLNGSGIGYATITATAAGTAYNVDANTIVILPVKYTGITTITNEAATTGGVDKETDEELYNRYKERVQNFETSGNVAHYKAWSESIEGVTSCSVIPLWNGNGTVKLVIGGENNTAVDNTLITATKNYIDPNNGDGSGLAPIGAVVTVVSITELALNISFTLNYNSTSYSKTIVVNNIKASITDYLDSLAIGTSSVSFNKIGSLIMDSSGVIDYSSLTINSGTSNISLTSTQVAKLGTVTC